MGVYIHVICENEMCDMAGVYFTRLQQQRINQHISHSNWLQVNIYNENTL